MAKFGKFSPSRSYPDLNTAMMSSPLLPNHSRDPRIADPWNLQERNTSKLPPFPEAYAHPKAIQSAPYPQFIGTPDTGEMMSPRNKYARCDQLSFHFLCILHSQHPRYRKGPLIV